MYSGTRTICPHSYMMTLHRQSAYSDDERRRRGATKLAPTRIVYVPRNPCSCECTDEKRLDKQVIFFFFFGSCYENITHGGRHAMTQLGCWRSGCLRAHRAHRLRSTMERQACFLFGVRKVMLSCLGYSVHLTATVTSCGGELLWIKHMNETRGTSQKQKRGVWFIIAPLQLVICCLLFVCEIRAEKNCSCNTKLNWFIPTHTYTHIQLLAWLF